jgi:hypothetical protein
MYVMQQSVLAFRLFQCQLNLFLLRGHVKVWYILHGWYIHMRSYPGKSGSCQLTFSSPVTEGTLDKLTSDLKLLP